jgi:hypothetical protein
MNKLEGSNWAIKIYSSIVKFFLTNMNNFAKLKIRIEFSEEELFGASLESLWEANQLQYIGMIFLAPRLICLLILIFGMLTSRYNRSHLM